MQRNDLSINLEPARVQVFARCQLCGPIDADLCRSQHRTKCQTFL